MGMKYVLTLALFTVVTMVCENPNMRFMNAYRCSTIDLMLDMRRFLRIPPIGILWFLTVKCSLFIGIPDSIRYILHGILPPFKSDGKNTIKYGHIITIELSYLLWRGYPYSHITRAYYDWHPFD
jgi:hypothetical protein